MLPRSLAPRRGSFVLIGLCLLGPASAGADTPAAKADPTGTVDPFAAQEKAKDAPAKPKADAVPFEQLLKEATSVTDLATLVEPLYANCNEGAPLARRQCEGIRDYLLTWLRGRLFVSTADVQPQTSPYDATAKEIELEVSGCLACSAPPKVAGEARYLTTRPVSQVRDGRPSGLTLSTYQLPMETKVSADRFLERVVPRLRVQHIYRIGPPFGDGAKEATPKGVQLQPVAHRVYDRCTGQITASSAPSGPVKVVADKSCPKKGAEEMSQAEIAQAERRAALPERLTSKEVDSALQPVQEKVHECYAEYQGPTGSLKVNLVLTGEGKLSTITLSAPFDKAEIALCIRSQLKSATFPKFRGEPMRIDYAFQVN